MGEQRSAPHPTPLPHPSLPRCRGRRHGGQVFGDMMARLARTPRGSRSPSPSPRASGAREGPALHGGEGQRSRVVAIDGPAASGKGTLARRLADRFDLAHLDTGALYRATAFLVLDPGGDPADPATAEAAARRIDRQLLADPRLRGEAV